MQVSLSVTVISGPKNGSLGLTKELDQVYEFIHMKILRLSRDFSFIVTFDDSVLLNSENAIRYTQNCTLVA